MGALLERARWAMNDDVIKMIRVAMCYVAIDVVAEAYGGVGQPTAEQHNLRSAFATRVLRDPEAWAVKMVWGVVVDPAIGAASTDADIIAQVRVIWDAYAGVVPATVS